MKREDKKFETKNLEEISILIASKKKVLVCLKNDENIVMFEFDDEKEDCNKIILDYYNNVKLVSPREYAEAERLAKNMMFNCIRENKVGASQKKEREE